MPRGEIPQVLHDGFVPGRFAIDAYGRGGFRFAEMSHKGSIIVTPAPAAARRASVAPAKNSRSSGCAPIASTRATAGRASWNDLTRPRYDDPRPPRKPG